MHWNYHLFHNSLTLNIRKLYLIFFIDFQKFQIKQQTSIQTLGLRIDNNDPNCPLSYASTMQHIYIILFIYILYMCVHNTTYTCKQISRQVKRNGSTDILSTDSFLSPCYRQVSMSIFQWHYDKLKRMLKCFVLFSNFSRFLFTW